MKKITALLLVLVLLLSFSSISFAEEATEGTKFEQVLLKKGSLMKKEFVDVTTIDDNSGLASFGYGRLTAQAAILTDMTTGEKYYALRLEHSYYASKYDEGTSVSVLDMDEIDSVISTLNSLKTEFTGNLVDYTEYVYTSNSGLIVGGYHSSDSDMLFIKFSSSDTAYFKFAKLDNLIKFFEDAKAGINSRK